MTSSSVKMPTSRSYHSYLIESLKDTQEAAAYLDAVLEECNYNEFCLALKNVAEARLSTLEGSQSNSDSPQERLRQREVVQKLFSSPTNLDLVSSFQALNNLGFKLSVVPSAI
jgi:DNA-binding phage protein